MHSFSMYDALRLFLQVEPLTTRYHGLLAKMRDGHHLGVYSVHYAGECKRERPSINS